MTRSSGEDIRELLVRSQMALRMLQVHFAKFLGVSDRTMRRWQSNGVHLDPRTLHTLVAAVHPKDAVLATRIAAVHGRILEDALRPLPPARDPEADRRLADALVLAAAQRANLPPPAMRAALITAFDGALSAGLTIDEAHALFAAVQEK